MQLPTKPFGTIKSHPEDFVVREMMAEGKVVRPIFRNRVLAPSGAFTAFAMTKVGISAEVAYRHIARQFGISRGQVSDYGMKDAFAVTAQVIVVEGDYTPTFSHEKIWLQQIGAVPGRAQHGDHAGNFFSILVRTDSTRPLPRQTFLNRFGPQRFGDGYLEVGRLLLEGKTAAAAALLLQSDFNGPMLQRIAQQNRFSIEAAMFHYDFSHELGMKIQAWQSHLWNLAAEAGVYALTGHLPMWQPKYADLYRTWWNPDLTKIDAGLLHRLSRSNRPVYAAATQHRVTAVSGGWRHEFGLRSGSYATVFLGELYELADASRQQYL